LVEQRIRNAKVVGSTPALGKPNWSCFLEKFMNTVQSIFFILFLSMNLMRVEQKDLWDGDDYDEHSKLQQVIALQFLNDLKEYFPILPRDAVVLDIGCGNGRVSHLLFDCYKDIQLMGIDSSPDMIDFAQSHFANPRMQFTVDQAEDLKSIAPCSIDAITSFSCMHWVFDKQSAFQRMHDVLKPGGWIGLMFAADTGFDDQLDHAFEQALQEQPWTDYFTENTEERGWMNTQPSEVKLQLSEIGFREIYAYSQTFDFYFDDRYAFCSWILASAQQLKLLPPDLQISCAERIVSLYLDRTSNHQPHNQQCIYIVDTFKVCAIK
jgi:trans-aconitate methyltransferase